MPDTPRHIELLAPARDADIARQAILHGADAVYMGGPALGARRAAANSLDDIRRAADYAHQYGARLYATFNTLIYDNELAEAERLALSLYEAGVDALIVQDMAVLRMSLPPIALHASTQCDIRTPEKARFLAECGFTQLVLPREATLDEIRRYRRAVPPEVLLEAFVHGALCVSYSGDCQAGYAAMRRSGNRGECPQICRLPFDLTDDAGNILIRQKHLLSLRDLNRYDALADMLDAGISSFKIEGRLKDASYVKTVTAAYSRRLDALVAASNGTLVRASQGRCDIRFDHPLTAAFNRGFTSYFLSVRPPRPMASPDTPKWVGERVATVAARQPRRGIAVDATAEINNGDGLGYFNQDGEYQGFRVNTVEKNILYPAKEVTLAPGTPLYRNYHRLRERTLEGGTATRVIDIDMTLRYEDGALTLIASDTYGNSAAVTETFPLEAAKTPQEEARRRVLAKTGDTIFALRTLDDSVGALFVPASLLTAMRRRVLDSLADRRRETYRRPAPGTERRDIPFPAAVLTRHDNVANALARRFYRDHGVAEPIPGASEVDGLGDDPVVMTTRYCLRRELGACLREKNATALPRQLYLVAPGIRYRLRFDCNACRMQLEKML